MADLVAIQTEHLEEILHSINLSALFSNRKKRDILKKEFFKKLSDSIYDVYSRKSTPPNVDAQIKEDFSLAFKKKLKPEEYFWLQKWWSTIGNFTDFQSPKGYCLIDKGSERKLVMPGNYLLQGIRADKYQNGTQRIDILFPKLYEDKFDGKDSFFWIHGKTHTNDFNDLPQILRFYFNLKTDKNAIINLREDIQVIFDDWGIPFSFKYLSKYDSFYRADSGVLYVSQKYFHIALWLVAQIYHENQHSLINSTPFFTYQLAPDLGFAEDPERNDGKSFGDWRSSQLTEAIYDNVDDDLALDKNKLLVSLATYGIVLGRTHLNENSRYAYNFDVFEEYLKVIPNYIKTKKFTWGGDRDFRNAAYNIAQQICKEAIWSKDETCTWVSVKKDKSTKYGFIDNSLKHGNAGITLSLVVINFIRNDYFFVKTIHAALGKIIKEQNLLDDINNAFIQKWLNQYDGNGYEIINGIEKVFEKVGTILKNESYLKISKAIKTALESVYTLNGFMLPISIEIGNGSLEANIKDFELMESTIPTGRVPKWEYYVDAAKLVRFIIKNFFEQDRLYINNIDGSTKFCPTLNDGLAGVGYFFAKVYDHSIGDIDADLLPSLESPKLQKFLSALESKF